MLGYNRDKLKKHIKEHRMYRLFPGEILWDLILLGRLFHTLKLSFSKTPHSLPHLFIHSFIHPFILLFIERASECLLVHTNYFVKLKLAPFPDLT